MSTILANASDKLLTMGDLYYCTDTVDYTSITKLTATNQSTVKTELDLYTYVTVGHINDFSVSHSLQNEEIIRAGNCGIGELARLTEKTPTISFTWLDVNNRPAFASMLGLDILNVAGTAVTGVNQVIASPFVANVFYPIGNQNGNGTAPTITSVTGSVDGAFASQADYFLMKQGDVWGIMLNSVAGGPAITTLAQTVTIVYSYTPNASTLDGYNIEKNAMPYGLYKFVSCPNPINSTQGIQDTIYFWKYVLSGDLVEKYVLLSSDTNFEGVEASFIGVTGGGYLKSKATVAL